MRINYFLKLSIFSALIISCKPQEVLLVKENAPSIVTKDATNVSFTTATLNGEVTDEGFTATTVRGFVFSDKNTNPSVSDTKVQSGYGKGLYFCDLEKLIFNNKYYYKAYSTNSKGTTYGDIQTFTTADYKLPKVITEVPSNITYFSADLKGSFVDDGGSKITQIGFCYGLNPNPTISDNTVIYTSGWNQSKFISSLINLKGNLRYYVRAYAISSKGVGYGNEQSFTTLNTPIVARDSKTQIIEVKTLTGRIWMDRNLGATKAASSSSDTMAIGDLYQWGRGADGHQLRTSAIESNGYSSSTLSVTDVPGNAIFIRNTTKGLREDWRLTQNDNLWQGVNGTNNPCPIGYRLPTIVEYKLEMETWKTVNGNYEKSAFASALKLPSSGFRTGDGDVKEGAGYYWTSTVIGVYSEFFGFSNFGSSYNQRVGARSMGMSVRCIKD